MSVSRHCFVPGCKSGYPSTTKINKEQGIKNASLFSAPKDTEMLNKWKKAIPRTDKVLGTSDAVCAVHFTESDIERFYETKMPDGTIHKIERGTPKLKKTAVPCIFPHLPHSLTTVEPVRKRPRIIKTKICHTKSTFNEDTIENSDEVEYVEQYMDVEAEKTCIFSILKNNLDKVVLPSTKWTKAYLKHLNNLVFVEWNDHYQTVKRVVLHSNLSIQVFVHDVEIHPDGVNKNILTVEELNESLKNVNDIILCEGFSKRKILHPCLGVVANETKRYERRELKNMCTNCRQAINPRNKNR